MKSPAEKNGSDLSWLYICSLDAFTGFNSAVMHSSNGRGQVNDHQFDMFVHQFDMFVGDLAYCTSSTWAWSCIQQASTDVRFLRNTTVNGDQVTRCRCNECSAHCTVGIDFSQSILIHKQQAVILKCVSDLVYHRLYGTVSPWRVCHINLVIHSHAIR